MACATGSMQEDAANEDMGVEERTWLGRAVRSTVRCELLGAQA